eukprot:TRINITY_DN1456_c0_g1_i1.p1 TRINITY_DN1456_c0_g1~~TRINITY_DN1456_c0_g1_i1.p1  ORF type:complete len:553 (-),score=77.00 TRINITY_DN1456_c0_g1_i1:496-2133(-)
MKRRARLLLSVSNSTKSQPENFEDPSFQVCTRVEHEDLSVVRTNLPIETESQKVNSFVLDNFLSQKATSQYLNFCESKHFEPLNKEFVEEFRSNERLTIYNERLADLLWNRLKLYLEEKDIIGVKPYGFGTGGTWKPIGLNPYFKFSRYTENTYFRPHLDSGTVQNEDTRSIYTIMIYLNDNFSGGETNFLKSCPKNNIFEETDDEQIAFRVLPKSGRALVFNHDAWHEGATVYSGEKYIMRTEVMFERTSSVSDTLSEKDVENMKEVGEFYQMSSEFENQGNIELSNQYFLKAQQLQASNSSWGDDFCSFDSDVWYIGELVAKIFLDLDIQDIYSFMQTSKDACIIARSGIIWEKIYLENFHTAEWQILKNSKSFLHDWYSLYCSRKLAIKFCSSVVVELDTFNIKYASIRLKNIYTVNNASGIDYIVHTNTPRYSDDRQYCFSNYYYGNIVIGNGCIENFHLFNAFCGWLYRRGFSPRYSINMPSDINPRHHPVLLTKGIAEFDYETRSKIAKSFFTRRAPLVIFVNTAVCALMSFGLYVFCT